VPKGAFGPRLKEAVATLTAKYHVSRRKLIEALKHLFGVELSVGAVRAICEEVSEVAAPAVSEVQAEVEKSPAVNADGTGWRQKGQMHWLWTAARRMPLSLCLHPIAGTRRRRSCFCRHRAAF